MWGGQGQAPWSQAADAVWCLLQDLPEHWDSTKKLCLRVKQNVAPLQAHEVKNIYRRCQEFEVPVLEPENKKAAS